MFVNKLKTAFKIVDDLQENMNKEDEKTTFGQIDLPILKFEYAFYDTINLKQTQAKLEY